MWDIFVPFILTYFQLLLGGVLFLIKAPRRKLFMLRASLSFAVCFCLIILDAYVMSVLNSGLTAMFAFMFIWLLAGASCFTCWKISIINVLFVSTGCYALQHIGYTLFLIVNELFTLNEVAYSVISYILPFAIIGLSYFTFIRRNSHIYNSAAKKQIFVAFLILLVSIVLSALKDICDKDVIYIAIYDIICCVCCLFIQFSISHNELDKQDKKMLETILTEENKQHELSNQAIAMMNVKFHDIKNRLDNLQKIIGTGKSESSLNEINRTVQIYASMANTGNSTLDAVLMEKGLLCEMNKVHFSYIADGKLLSFMEIADVFSLFNNLLDNAIESVLKEEDSEKRIVSMRIVSAGEAVLVSVENYCSHKVDFSKGAPPTTKSDKASHGIGMRGINYVVDKYSGTIRYSQEDNMVCASVLFNV